MLIEARECFVDTIESVQDHSVVQQNLRRGFAQVHRLGNKAQRFGGLPFGELDDAEHLQGVEVVRPVAKDLLIETFGLRQTPVRMQVERVRKGLRNLERLRLRRRRHELRVPHCFEG